MIRKTPHSLKIGLLFVFILSIPYSLSHIIPIYFYSVSPYFAYKNVPTIYQPIVADLDMTSNYVPRAREVMEGNLFVSDIGFKKYKDHPPYLSVLGPIVFGTFAKVLDSPGKYLYGLVNAKIFTDMLFSFLILLIFFFIFRSILDGWLLPVLMLCLSIVKLHFYANLTYNFTPAGIINGFSYLFRLKNYDIITDTLRWECPILTFIFFGLFFLAGIHAVKNTKLRYLIPWAVSTGILCYVYPFHYIYASVSFFLVMAYLIVSKQITARDFLVTFSIYALVVSLYYYNYLHFTQFENFLDVKRRLGFEEGRFFRWALWPGYLLFIFLGGIIVRLYRRTNDTIEKRLFALAICFLATNIITLNIQIITGFIPHPDHWHRYAIGPAFGIILAIMISCLVKYAKSEQSIFSKWNLVGSIRVAVLILIIWFSSSHYVSSLILADKNVRWGQFPYEYIQAMDVINKHSEPNDIVLSINLRVNSSLFSYTSTNPYFLNGILTLASHEEIVERFLYGNYIFGVPVSEVREALSYRPHVEYFFNNYYVSNKPGWGVYNVDPSANWAIIVPEKEKDLLVEKYRNLNFKIEDVLTTEIDFIIESPDDYYKSTSLSMNISKYYELIDDSNGWRIWRLKHELN